ncbi:PaaX family transcriptional regulator [Halobacillus naozhouensis]|uniref:PaaX family transcriptional regulator C-terminal domain-containing protein n=1 Tax=Halobacillus naozhouensis TaxID=554880 RepID=A0ABY8J5J9_9BACI|nr:PaaX family transcriptional regulator C-terminal domain-containing protein [Halobacillus naozhouensis]WFT76872.1 PaaX family transcriptional regulator C-terminal domain-containing protein [Halobacillus naozhouensis]
MKPRSLMFTLFGEYVQNYGGEIWVGSLIQMMERFGVSESSVRGAILRMVQKDLMKVRKIGNRSYYSFTPQGINQINEGVKRVYSERNAKWDGQWRILTYSFPEAKRDMRNEIRKELNWTGFGAISNSTWVSPNPIEKQVMELMERHQLGDYMMLFTSSKVMSHDNQEIVNKGWDLQHISDEYDRFIQEHLKIYDYLREKALQNTLTDEESFIERTKIVHEYRKFLFNDPIFPVDLLPENFRGTEARELFWKIHQMISIPAVRCFESLYESAPDREVEPHRERAVNPFNKVYM